MPEVELQIFSGDPLHYHEFIQTFDHNVDKVCSDGDLKLTRLMQYSAGPAKEAIRGCQLIGGEKGYDQAKKVLEERFGNAHLVAERVMKNLRRGNAVKSSSEIQQLANEMNNSLLVLNKLLK